MAHDVSKMNIATIISEMNMLGGSSPKEWWIVTITTRHVSFDKDLFTVLKVVENGEKLFIENSTSSKIKEVMKMTFGKELNFNNVLCIPKIHKT